MKQQNDFNFLISTTYRKEFGPIRGFHIDAYLGEPGAHFFDGIRKIHVLKIYKFSKYCLNFLIGIPISSSQGEDNQNMQMSKMLES